RIYRELCTSKVVVFEQKGGRQVDQFLKLCPYSADTLALRLCQVWLHQAFFGHGYPVDPFEHSIIVGNDSHLRFDDCDFIFLPRKSRTNLWDYLVATANDDPDKAAMHLLLEMSRPGDTRVDPEAFRSSFRQAASFGILQPVLGTNSNALAHLV